MGSRLDPTNGIHCWSKIPEKFRKNITKDGLKGWRAKCIPASSGVRSPFFELQYLQAVVKLSHEVLPCLDFGITWSNVKWSLDPQY